jgi:ATP-dependent RNA helicase RhlB
MSAPILTDLDFASFELHASLQDSLKQAGFERLTPIQALTMPETLRGRDVAGQAQTGTGKTAAFLVTAFQRILSRPARAERAESDPRVFILAPTRELAVQIHKDAVLLSAQTGLRLGLAFGGVDYEKQKRDLEAGVDVLIGTPGRLIDFYKQHVYSLKAVEVMIIDEADRMFDLGFIADVRYMMRKLPPRTERQSMLFSATLSQRVLELAYEHMNDPMRLTVASDSVTAARVEQSVYFPASEEKLPLLLGLMASCDPARSIVFVNTKHAAGKIHARLARVGLPAAILSGDVPQRKRMKLLERFAAGQIAILVATDVAARGLHIPDVSHVFNYDLPQDAEDYVHRVGRTARFGSSGNAISFACENYAISLPDIEKYIGQKIPVQAIDPAVLKMLPKPVLVDAAIAAEASPEALAEDRKAADATPKGKRRRPRKKPGGGKRSNGAPSAARGKENS